MTERKLGENARRLMLHKASRDAIPSGGGMADGIAFLMDTEKMKASFQAATEWTFAAIDVMKTAPDNPYGDDDEAIAGAYLAEIERREDEILLSKLK